RFVRGQSGQVIVWDRGRPARNAPTARNLSEVAGNTFSRFALICGRDARGPRQSLDRTAHCPLPDQRLLLRLDLPTSIASDKSIDHTGARSATASRRLTLDVIQNRRLVIQANQLGFGNRPRLGYFVRLRGGK